MRIKIAVFFILTILIPTALLAHFGLLSVRNEKEIVERSMRQKYAAMAAIVEEEIKAELSQAPAHVLGDPQQWNAILLNSAGMFKDEVVLFDRRGAVLGGKSGKAIGDAVFTRPLRGLPYTIGVYEKYPALLANLEAKKKGLVFYISIIIFSVFSILGGSIFTLSALANEWRQARLKGEFASHLSHDLRRPLTSIRMFSEMLKNGDVPNEDKRKEYYGIISEESDKLTLLANNILDFSRIESGRRKYNIKEEDITRIVREAVERFKVYTIKEGRSIALFVDPADEGWEKREKGEGGYPIVKVDAGAIAQAIMNLLTNADKYSPADKQIKVNLKRAKKTVAIEVIDRGEGIPQEEIKRIFQKFYRVPRKDVASVEGSGLGLALVKYTVEAHGGHVEVESKKGRGSTFRIILPV